MDMNTTIAIIVFQLLCGLSVLLVYMYEYINEEKDTARRLAEYNHRFSAHQEKAQRYKREEMDGIPRIK